MGVPRPRKGDPLFPRGDLESVIGVVVDSGYGTPMARLIGQGPIRRELGPKESGCGVTAFWGAQSEATLVWNPEKEGWSAGERRARTRACGFEDGGPHKPMG